MRAAIYVPLLLSGWNAFAGVRVAEVAVDGVVHPITTEIVSSAINRASAEHDALLIVRLNTPGGLSEAMRESVQKMIASPVPIATFVAPQGARAASAGFFLLEAGDVAAMSPGANTGAAHPVILGSQMDPVMKEKLENDAAASLRSVTSQRGRNVSLAESAVRESKSFSSREALDGNLIDLLASDDNDLLRQLDGRAVTRFDGKRVTLHLKDAAIVPYELTLRQRVLSAISDPNLALVLLALGVLGIYVEFVSPGLIFAGVLGSIFALLGLGALTVLPLNWMGASLLILGFALFVMEWKFASHGVLTLGGAVAMVLGSTMLIDSPSPEMRIHLSTSLAVTLPLALISVLLVTLAVRAKQNKVVTGAEGMVGQFGVALDNLEPNGKVLVHGEYWTAWATSPIARGSHIRVDGIADLRLRVTPVVEERVHS